jgi:hypothetical protein
LRPRDKRQTCSLRYAKKLGRLLWQQAAPFVSSIALLLLVLTLIVVITLSVVVTDIEETLQDRSGRPAV